MEITKPGPLDGPRQEIRCGDATSIVKFKRAKDSDLVFMDPPYNIDIDYGDHNHLTDRRPREEYLASVADWIYAAIGVLRPSGILAVLISEAYAMEYERILSGCDLVKVNRIIWHEKFAQYSETKFTNEHRHLFLYRKPGLGERTWNTDAEYVRVPSARMLAGDKRAKGPRVPGDVWDCPRLPGNANARVDWHPCQLHPAPLRRLVSVFTNEGGRVSELFSGSGSLAVVCKELNRHYVGVDASKKFVVSARKRIERYEHYVEE